LTDQTDPLISPKKGWSQNRFILKLPPTFIEQKTCQYEEENGGIVFSDERAIAKKKSNVLFYVLEQLF
jgi:hypothetical protein